jgi:hypothetical protein
MFFPPYAPRLANLETVNTAGSTLLSLTGSSAVPPNAAPAPAQTPAQPGPAADINKSTRKPNHSPDPAFENFGKMTGFAICAVVDKFVLPTEKGGLGKLCSSLPLADDGKEICLAFQIRAHLQATCHPSPPHAFQNAAHHHLVH